ncbi:MAG TPA: cytochrome P450 [Chloroflexia bacterium]|nr:cytochrome P450 [Chloroflexia bacterium]
MSKSVTGIPVVDLSGIDVMAGDVSEGLARLAVEYGPIFGWRVGGGPAGGQMRLMMVGPEANRFVMHTHRHHFSHDLGWTPILGEAFGQGLLNMDDPEHARHRKMWNPAFASAYMGAYLPVMQRVIEERTSTWAERAEVDLYTESREITFDIAAGALAGFGTGPTTDRLRRHFYFLLHGYTEHETFEEYMAKAQQVQSELLGVLLAMIAERRNASPGERPGDVLAMIVHARDEEGNTLPDAQVLGHLMILLVAGHETTTTLGAWVLYLLATMPEQRALICEELEAVLGNTGGEITMDAVRAMKKLDNFVRETGRLYPPVINVPRGVVEEFEFNGYTVPAGSQVRLSLGACHRLPGVFQNPNEFDPDRLAPPREEDKKQPYSLVTFGGGPRVCIGQHFAHVETKVLAAHVLRHYTLEPIEGQHPKHAGFFNAIIPGGIRMRVLHRA